jgi:hypothetical protein
MVVVKSRLPHKVEGYRVTLTTKVRIDSDFVHIRQGAALWVSNGLPEGSF